MHGPVDVPNELDSMQGATPDVGFDPLVPAGPVHAREYDPAAQMLHDNVTYPWPDW